MLRGDFYSVFREGAWCDIWEDYQRKGCFQRHMLAAQHALLQRVLGLGSRRVPPWAKSGLSMALRHADLGL